MKITKKLNNQVTDIPLTTSFYSNVKLMAEGVMFEL